MTRRAAGALAPLIISAAALSGCAGRYNRELIAERQDLVYGGDLRGGRSSTETTLRSSRPFSEGLTHVESRSNVSLAGAGPELSLIEGGTLASFVAVALERSGDVRAAFEEWRASAERVEQVSSLPRPRLTYTEYLTEVQTRTGPQRRAFGLAQTVPWPGLLRARARVADEQAEALWQRVEAIRLTVQRDVEIAYFALAFLGRELEIRSALTDILKEVEEVVQVRVRAGAGQEDLLRIQVEVGRLEDDVARIERERPAVTARLVAAMNLPDSSIELPMPTLEEPLDLKVTDVDSLLDRALKQNPSLRALNRQLQARREGESLAELSRWPDLTVALSTITTGSAVNPSTSGSGRDPVILSLSIPLPVWVSTDDAVTRGAQHQLRAARARLDQGYANLVSGIEQAAFARDDANRRIALFRDSLIPRAEEALGLTLISYRAGSASVLDLIDSERALLEFQLIYWSACRSSSQAHAQIHALVGSEDR